MTSHTLGGLAGICCLHMNLGSVMSSQRGPGQSPGCKRIFGIFSCAKTLQVATVFTILCMKEFQIVGNTFQRMFRPKSGKMTLVSRLYRRYRRIFPVEWGAYMMAASVFALPGTAFAHRCGYLIMNPSQSLGALSLSLRYSGISNIMYKALKTLQCIYRHVY